MLRAGDSGDLLRTVGEANLLRRREHLDRKLRMPVMPGDELWSDLHSRLGGFIRKRIGDADAADDVAQEVMLRLHRGLGELRSEDRLDAFAYRVARNAIIDHYRSRSTAREISAPPEALMTSIDGDHGADSDAGDDHGRQELARCLAPLVGRLREPYREALTLTDLGSLSQVQAADAVGVSVPGMKARVQRARAQVHELLTECCEVALDRSERIADVQRTGPCACGDRPDADLN